MTAPARDDWQAQDAKQRLSEMIRAIARARSRARPSARLVRNQPFGYTGVARIPDPGRRQS